MRNATMTDAELLELYYFADKYRNNDDNDTNDAGVCRLNLNAAPRYERAYKKNLTRYVRYYGQPVL